MNAPQRGTPAAKAAGARRRVIEGEGLGASPGAYSSIPVLPGGSGATHNFFHRRARGSSPVTAVLGPRGVHVHGAKRAQVGRNIDPLAARQDDIARKYPEMPIFPAATLDNISGAYGETLGQGGRLTVDWQTHGTLFVWVGHFQIRTPATWRMFQVFSDGPMTACGLLWVSDRARAASPDLPEHGRKR